MAQPFFEGITMGLPSFVITIGPRRQTRRLAARAADVAHDVRLITTVPTFPHTSEGRQDNARREPPWPDSAPERQARLVSGCRTSAYKSDERLRLVHRWRKA